MSIFIATTYKESDSNQYYDCIRYVHAISMYDMVIYCNGYYLAGFRYNVFVGQTCLLSYSAAIANKTTKYNNVTNQYAMSSTV